MSASGVLLLKNSDGINFTIEKGLLNLQFSFNLVLGIIMYVVNFLLLIVLLPKFNLCFFFPIIIGTTQLIVLFCAHYIFNEPITKYNLIGVFFVITGVIFICYTQKTV